ncbi:class I SAM-dependent methyltransferase [Frankia sp. CNm7]|uniref:Class I SAM-dependent methyltransferase n=1 Tax=Frankia nepalensis TaxID=1836974 RepID=A0A937RH93_9ACTN|nr:class I SAM-dependent methyltransferase [Frankia nepalensis]MBL7500374.1 class I SAM-dependent methyltransferase [Frankia nepalensis]MBL7508672.1 class I SAM-dependent methyltransferase [Frankia nepalensis]MBL7522999.1 class I SAM-dependent methyltransferase [Frankia nepalensis]MBL7628834.1 class I SAM-dependent methyltransferase [Frankia nepalensis]
MSASTWDRFTGKLRRACQKKSMRTPFGVRMSDGYSFQVGDGEPRFWLESRSSAGDRALSSMDLFQVGDAFIAGALDIQGDMVTAFASRKVFSDFHPIVWIRRFAPLALGGRGQRQKDDEAIAAHYDEDADFFRTFLDRDFRCYTHGVFTTGNEPLETAMANKMRYAYDSLELKPGARVLEVGGGWGAFLQYGSEQGARVTSLTLSRASETFMNDLAKERGYDATVVRQHLFAYEGDGEKYDALVNMGVTEHLPDYQTTLRKYAALVRPGGLVYLDAVAMRRKHHLSSFMSRHIYPGRSTPLVLHDYLACVARSPFRVRTVIEDTRNYLLTCRAWALRLEAAREQVTERWGTELYLKFRAFLWGSTAGFVTGQLQAYRLVLEQPDLSETAALPG